MLECGRWRHIKRGATAFACVECRRRCSSLRTARLKVCIIGKGLANPADSDILNMWWHLMVGTLCLFDPRQWHRPTPAWPSVVYPHLRVSRSERLDGAWCTTMHDARPVHRATQLYICSYRHNYSERLKWCSCFSPSEMLLSRFNRLFVHR